MILQQEDSRFLIFLKYGQGHLIQDRYHHDKVDNTEAKSKMNLSVFRYKGYIIDNNVLIRRVQNMVGYNVSSLFFLSNPPINKIHDKVKLQSFVGIQALTQSTVASWVTRFEVWRPEPLPVPAAVVGNINDGTPVTRAGHTSGVSTLATSMAHIVQVS